jgi:hypothetical protein
MDDSLVGLYMIASLVGLIVAIFVLIRFFEACRTLKAIHEILKGATKQR